MHQRYIRRKIKHLRENGKRAAQKRWSIHRALQAAFAAVDPVRVGHIARRIVDIRRESDVREIVLYTFDSERECRRKLRSIGL